MIYRIGSQIIRIPQGADRKAIGTVVAWRDVAETCRCLHAILRCVPEPPDVVVDGIAGSGFWGAVFRETFPEIAFHQLNEMDERCLPILHQHFPQATITSLDLKEWEPDDCDIGLLEFHKFTLMMMDEWAGVLKIWAGRSKRLIIADGACFGFKFGNLKHYGASQEIDYYMMLDEALYQITNKRITAISKFSNAAIILLEKCRHPRMKFIPPSLISLSRDGKPLKIKTTHKANTKEGLWAGTGQ